MRVHLHCERKYPFEDILYFVNSVGLPQSLSLFSPTPVLKHNPCLQFNVETVLRTFSIEICWQTTCTITESMQLGTTATGRASARINFCNFKCNTLHARCDIKNRMLAFRAFDSFVFVVVATAAAAEIFPNLWPMVRGVPYETKIFVLNIGVPQF